MSVYKKIFTTIILFGLVGQVFAAGGFPRGCESSGFAFQDQYITFNDTGRQMYFLVQNRSGLNLELERISTTPAFMTPKLQTKIASGEWAAFASDLDSTHFKCGVRNQDNEIAPVRCVDVLAVCQYPRVRFALSNMGTYWVSTNKPLTQVIQDSTKKGIYLKW